jgi:hypothetical protein
MWDVAQRLYPGTLSDTSRSWTSGIATIAIVLVI